MTLHDLPTLNAILNGMAAVFLFFGWRAIRKKQVDRHRKWMVAALVTSIAFLTSYLVYHFGVQIVTKYPGTGILRGVYYCILFTHIPLAILMVPFIFYAVWQAMKKNFEKHKKVTRIVWPVWMYVSVTGVLVYLMLYRF